MEGEEVLLTSSPFYCSLPPVYNRVLTLSVMAPTYQEAKELSAKVIREVPACALPSQLHFHSTET